MRACIAQEAVPIGPEDTAAEVFGKVTGGAERVLRGAAAADRRQRAITPQD